MDSDLRRVVGVLLVLSLAVVAVAVWWNVREARAPVLDEVRPVFRPVGAEFATTEPDVVAEGVEVEIAALVTYHRGKGGAPRRICGLRPVRSNGLELAVDDPASFPVSGGVLRAIWYSVEPSLFGWQEVGSDQVDKLAYSDFIATEMGRGLVTTVSWESHNDDFISGPPPGNILPGGARRFKVRVAAYSNENEIIPVQAVTSPGAGEVFDGRVAALVRRVDAVHGLDPAISGLLRLGCYSFAGGVWPTGGAGWPLAISPADLVERRYITTPATFAAAAVGGDPLAHPWDEPVALTPQGEGWVSSNGVRLQWDLDVGAGDVLRAGEQYLVLLRDDGDGALTLADQALIAWREPARVAPIGSALLDETGLELLRGRRKVADSDHDR